MSHRIGPRPPNSTGPAPSPQAQTALQPADEPTIPLGHAPHGRGRMSAPAPRAANVRTQRPVLPGPAPQAGQAANAAHLCEQSFHEVVSMFQDAKQGRPPSLDVVEQTADELLNALDKDGDILIGLVRLKLHSDYACMHSIAVCALMGALAGHMGFDKALRRQAAMAGLLHDIGKAFISPRILAKPGQLTNEEFAEVRTHPERGYRLLASVAGMPQAVMDVALNHHQRPDGKGYPGGLSSTRLSLFASMGTLCDVYDAVVSNRPYKDGWDPATAMQRMREWTQAGQFDAKVMAALSELMGLYPMGSLVRLRSRRLAVVSAQTPKHPNCPCVIAFYCLATDRLLAPEWIDLSRMDAADAIVGTESNAEWRFKDLDALWAGDIARKFGVVSMAKPSIQGMMLR